MSKEHYIAALEQLMGERMADWEEAHPNATAEEYARAEARIYDQTADAAYDRMQDHLAAAADHARDIRKEIIAAEMRR